MGERGEGSNGEGPKSLQLRLNIPSSGYSTPSGFWPPPKSSGFQRRPEAIGVGEPGSSLKRNDISCNPLLLGATTSVAQLIEPSAEEMHVRMDSIMEDSVETNLPIAKLGTNDAMLPVSMRTSGVSPQMRQRSRKIMNTRRITSPITRHSDVVWQENPSRILKYRASTLHLYGWVPFLIWRNIKATVFGNYRMYLQTVILVSWMVAIHLTGLGAPTEDIQAFVRIFSTQYMGAVFNVGTVVVFILGLFVTLVINRWWAMRAVYAKLASNTVDVATVISNVIRHPVNRNDPRVKRARTELIRFLNLGHLLVLTQADGQSRHFYKNRTLEILYNRTLGKIRSQQVPKIGEDSCHTWQKAARDISFLDLNAEGLVNVDEWQHIVDSEKRGMPRYVLAYHWAQAMLHELQARGWIYNSAQSLPAMLNKLSTIVDSGSAIFTYINSQLPYPYVHLVSLTVHSYLWILATYLGALLYGGFHETPGFVHLRPGETSSTTTDGILADVIVDPSNVSGLLVAAAEKIDGYVLTVVFTYFFMILAIVVFQGLVDMHTLLDNPFGRHCAKFPLRAQITELMNTCRSLIQTGDTMPECFQDVFQDDVMGEAVEGTADQPKRKEPAVRPERKPGVLKAHQRNTSVDFTSPTGVPVSAVRNKSNGQKSPLRAKVVSPPKVLTSLEPKLFKTGIFNVKKTDILGRKSVPVKRAKSLGSSLEMQPAEGMSNSQAADQRLAQLASQVASGMSPFELVQSSLPIAQPRSEPPQGPFSETSSLRSSPTAKVHRIESSLCHDSDLPRRLSTGDVKTPH